MANTPSAAAAPRMSAFPPAGIPDSAFEALEARMRAKSLCFVGNSLTYWNRGVDTMVRGLAPGATTQTIVEGGATLESHWRAGRADGLNGGGFDYVVLQDDLPETTAESFAAHAAKWIDAVRGADATPILFCAHAYARLPRYDDDAIAELHAAVGATHDVAVAPVGAARRSAADLLGVQLFDADGEHPSLAGTYLAACVVAATIFGPDVLAAEKPYRPKNLKAALAAQLRDVALGQAAPS